MPNHGHWLRFAQQTGQPFRTEEYAAWLHRLDQICQRFIDLGFIDLFDAGNFLPYEAFIYNNRPEEFFRDCIIPFVENEHGADFIYEHIADNVMWGSTLPPDFPG